MLTIQDVGNQILNQKPKNLYMFCGTEYGIKTKYISILNKFYGGRIFTYGSVMTVINYMRTKHFIQPEPSLYVVRYDEDFVSSLSESIANYILDTKILGTIICIYENDKHTTKLNKFLPDNTVSIDSVSKQFIEKYLMQDFKNLPESCVKNVASVFDDYMSAYNVCISLSNVDRLTLQSITKDEICSSVYTKPDGHYSNEIKKIIASRNYTIIIQAVDSYPSTLDNFLYDVMSTMLELEKLICFKSETDLSKYVKRWTISDIYNLFQWSYTILNEVRTNSSDVYERIMFLVSMVTFNPIPSVGEFNEL